MFIPLMHNSQNCIETYCFFMAESSLMKNYLQLSLLCGIFLVIIEVGKGTIDKLLTSIFPVT